MLEASIVNDRVRCTPGDEGRTRGCSIRASIREKSESEMLQRGRKREKIQPSSSSTSLYSPHTKPAPPSTIQPGWISRFAGVRERGRCPPGPAAIEPKETKDQLPPSPHAGRFTHLHPPRPSQSFRLLLLPRSNQIINDVSDQTFLGPSTTKTKENKRSARGIVRPTKERVLTLQTLPPWYKS